MVSKRTMIINDKEVAIRSYEVSIWTLQDSFITVLKWAHIDNKGLIQEPEMVIDVDGTLTFKFSIPMYLEIGKENPNWYNTMNGNLMIGMRKIKVILNKQTEDEAVFEFLITKVTERHEADTLFCDVECEGLAFHELGKIGYKISLSLDTYESELDKWYGTDGDLETMPRETIQFWNDQTEFFENNEVVPGKWQYKIVMDWSGYSSAAERASDKVYEDEYVSSWKLNTDTNTLIPETVLETREKERPVEISDSNMYNITQKIAEAFGVFCRYEYGYDENYHIISRTVIYYNNFIEEQHGHMDLTYPYHTSLITREMDSTELTTKLFVRDVDYAYSDSNKLTIMAVDANKSREDYVLNFDYLHKFNIITDELYEAIEEYEKNLHDINILLETKLAELIVKSAKKTEYEAQATVAANGIEEATKLLQVASDRIDALRQNKEDGIVSITTSAPKLVVVLTDETDNSLYVKMPFNGIIPGTVQLYDGVMDYTKTNPLENAILIEGRLEFDLELNELVKITHLPKTIVVNEEEEETVSLGKSLWLVCDYKPSTYWEKISVLWTERIKGISATAEDYQKKVKQLENELSGLESSIKKLSDLKKQIISDFEEMMGPALREGYWQPEDYVDYGDRYLVSIGTRLSFENGIINYNLYDESWYNNNNKVSYQVGDDLENYLCIKLDSSNFEYLQENFKNLYFFYYDVLGINLYLQLKDEEVNEVIAGRYKRNAKRLIKLGGACRISFIKENNIYYPVLVIEASKLMSAEQISFFKRQEEYAGSGYADYGSKIGTVIFEDTGEYNINAGAIDILSSAYVNSNIKEVYPRIIIDSLNLKANEDGVKIKFGDTILKEYEDYSIHVEMDESAQRDKYMIDIKPMAYVNAGTIAPNITLMYELSNAATFIYLDALLVAKENSEPKVSYTIDLSIYDPNIIHTIYKKLSKIVHINDVLLKFENVLGYISHIEMYLDTPWEDNIEIKNYKTKFEDLFSNIVAQTDAMLKNSYSYDKAAAAFTPDGGLTSDTVIKMLNNNSPLFLVYIDEHLTNNPVIKETLQSVFSEAGSILGSAGSAISDIQALTSRNAGILASFAEDASHSLTLIRMDEGGIFMGSDLRISLFSGDTIGNGVSIDLDPLRLLLGASSSTANTTAAKFTDKYIVLAAGDVITSSETLVEESITENGTTTTIAVPETNLNTYNVTGTINGLVGAKFTKDSIGFATYDGSTINAILMNNKGITLGSGVVDPVDTENRRIGIDLNSDTLTLRNNDTTVTGASYVRISGAGIDIGSGGKLYVDTNNFVVNSAATSDKSIFELKKLTSSGSYETALKYSLSDGLAITGTITANKLYIIDNNEAKEATDWVNAKVTPDAIWLGVKARTASNYSENQNEITAISLTNDGVDIKSGGKFSVNSSNVIINTDANINESIFLLKNNSGTINYLNIKRTGQDTVAAELAGWSIANGILYSGASTNYVGLCSSNDVANYAIWAGQNTASDAPFAVMRNGLVYLNKLMVLDPDKTLPGDHVQKGDEWFTAIDFSRLNFKLAVSVTGSWSGSTFDVNVSLWGVLNKLENLNASISVDTEATFLYFTGDYNAAGSLVILYLPGGGSDDLYFSLNCKNIYDHGYANADAASIEEKSNMANYGSFTITRGDGTTKDLTCSVQKAYNAGWNACRQAMLNSASSHTYYNGPSLVYNQSLDVWVTNTDRVSVTTYTVPAAK